LLTYDRSEHGLDVLLPERSQQGIQLDAFWGPQRIPISAILASMSDIE